jgi:hypothetical protein
MIHPAPSAERNAGWEYFPHDADVGVRGLGARRPVPIKTSMRSSLQPSTPSSLEESRVYGP